MEQLPEEEQFLPVFASSDIEIYPFQIAAASFALHSPYQKGAVLCDEAGMGKSHEAMLVINQKWLEGCNRILLVIPNADLLHQWTEMLDRFYTVPYVVLTSRKEWQAHSAPDHPNAFIQDAIVITTYDFAADNEEAAKVVNWDLTVFEEANALSPVYQEDNKQAKEVLYFLSLRLYSTTRLAAVRGQSDRNIRKLRKTIHKKLQRQMYDHLCGKQEHGGSLTLRERQFLEEYSKIARKQGKDAVIRRENKFKRRKKKNRP